MRRAAILGTEMAYVETGPGGGRNVVFLHGNPTSSYLWRHVIPELEDVARCLAPDLVGMGQSGPSGTGGYRFADHAAHLDAWFDAAQVDDAVLVVHDWGSALGFDWARRNPDRVAGIAYMEAIVRPVTWADWPEDARRIFQAMRSPAGEEIVLQKNVFVERILPASIIRQLTPEEMDAYRRPFPTPESRLPVLQWPREIPVDGVPADVAEIVTAYGRWLEESDLPKLFVNGDPGSILTGAQRDYCRTWPNQREVTVPGIHFLQEDSPKEIGRAVRDFVSEVGARL
jgi:haloalkane dehalogenase